MTDDRGCVSIRIVDASDFVALTRRLRQIVAQPVGELAASIRARSPISVTVLFGLDHFEKKRALLALFNDLDGADVAFEVVLDGETVTREHLRNRLRRWHEITYDVQMETDLETGEPGEEALRWATGDFEYPPEEE